MHRARCERRPRRSGRQCPDRARGSRRTTAGRPVPPRRRGPGVTDPNGALGAEQVFAVVQAAVARVLELDPATIGRNTTFSADLGADSLALVEVVEIVEEELSARVRGFTIDDDDVEDLATIGA